MQINLNKLYEISKNNRISLESVLLLNMIQLNVDLKPYIINNKLVLLNLQTLIRKQLINNNKDSYTITPEGKELIKQLEEPDQQPKAVSEGQFEELWDLYPSTDKYEGYLKTRNLRTDKDKCKQKYLDILKTYNHEDIMEALAYEIRELQDITRRENKNKFSFMKALPTWLNTKHFAIIMEEISSKGKYENDMWEDEVG